jgi:hypothetical protein
MKEKLTPIVENVAESTAACLVTMVQGNLLAVGLSHWIIASQTGVIAGAVTSAAIIAAQADNRRVVAIVLGSVTAVVDFFMHPGSFGPVFLEALVTGAGAALLSWLAGSAYRFFQRRRTATRHASAIPDTHT